MTDVTSTERLERGDKITVTVDGRDLDMVVNVVYTDQSIAQANGRTVLAHIRPGGYSVTLRNDNLRRHNVRHRVMHKAVKIRLMRAEGPSHQCGKWVEFTTDPWTGAHFKLRAWSITAPGGPGQSDLGVDKTDFEVTWEDGQTYTGTFGLTFDDTDLPRHIRGFLQHLIDHEDDYRRGGVDTPSAEDVRKFMNTHEIGATA